MHAPRIREGRDRPGRMGALTLETALVLPVIIFLVLGIVVGGMGIFRYIQLAGLTREASRYVSVKGARFAAETKTASPTEEQVLTDVVRRRAVGMDLSRLSIKVELIDGVTGDASAWDLSTREPTTRTPQGEAVSNRARVTLTYLWVPEVLLAGPLTMSSVSEVPMSF